MANEIAMDDMDIDFDVDPEIEELKQQAAALQHVSKSQCLVYRYLAKLSHRLMSPGIVQAMP